MNSTYVGFTVNLASDGTSQGTYSRHSVSDSAARVASGGRVTRTRGPPLHIVSYSRRGSIFVCRIAAQDRQERSSIGTL